MLKFPPALAASRRRAWLCLLALTAACAWLPATAMVGAGENDNEKAAAVEKRVDSLLAQLTQDEKIRLLSGTEDEMHVPGIARLGIPELKFSDGPIGVRCWGKSTAYPCGAMLAASFNADLASALGTALGRDCRARAVHVLLGPGVDLYRQAQCGRNFEYFGEDPYLSAQLASAWVKAVQAQGVAVSVKHYAVNDQETQRDSINTIVDERRLHEICLPPFKAAVQDGNAWTVMAAYNKVNGYWCTANRYLLSDVLRDQWGFKGVLMSDWGAVHEAPGPLQAGTDLEMGKTTYYTKQNIDALIKEGKVSQAQIDEHVRRILRMSVAMGFLDSTQLDGSIPLNDPQSAQTALRVAREGLVLLKNRDGLLPLDRTKTHKLVVIGPNACPAVTGGGGSSLCEPFASVSILDAVKNAAAPDAQVAFVPTWIGIGNENVDKNSFNNKGFFEPLAAGGARAAHGEYFENGDLQGAPKVVRDDASINYLWDKWHPDDQIKSAAYSVRWTGKIKAPQTDDYTFIFSSDGARVKLDGKTIFDNWAAGKSATEARQIHMKADEVHDVIVEYHHLSGSAAMQFTFAKWKDTFTKEEESQIASADAVIACMGYNQFLESEGFDRTYQLPPGQGELLDRVAKLNPRTVVVLNAGGNTDMSGWIDRVGALIHAWYPGQNGNTAVVEAVFGDINPSGRLPDTFEKRWQDSPAYGSYPGDPQNGGTIKYNEGIFVGYRWFDKKNIAPRFPFGYGLSYTTFAMDNLKVSPGGQKMAVSVDVQNTGNRQGAAVVQLYVRPLSSPVERPVQELKGFARIELNAGEKRTVVLPLDRSSFALWDSARHDWDAPDGPYEIAIGSSSRDIACKQQITWHQ